MKRRTIYCALAACSSLVIESAQAQLFDRGGGLIYDSGLDVTWLSRRQLRQNQRIRRGRQDELAKRYGLGKQSQLLRRRA